MPPDSGLEPHVRSGSPRGYRQWNLVGHSMGGFLALHIAAAWPERSASVATISATTFGVSATGNLPESADIQFESTLDRRYSPIYR